MGAIAKADKQVTVCVLVLVHVCVYVCVFVCEWAETFVTEWGQLQRQISKLLCVCLCLLVCVCVCKCKLVRRCLGLDEVVD